MTTLNQAATWADCRVVAEALGDVDGRACRMAESLGYTPDQISGVYAPTPAGVRLGAPFQLTLGRYLDGEPFVIVTADGATDPAVMPERGAL